MSLNDIAFVTGARGGIGRALVARLRARGLRVAAVGRDGATLAEVPAEAHIAADITTPEGAAVALKACHEQLGAAPSWLAHAVGSTLIAPLHRTKAEAAREVLRVNLESSLLTLQAWIAALEGGTTSDVLLAIHTVNDYHPGHGDPRTSPIRRP